MKEPTFLYTYLNPSLNKIYVGIGGNMRRVWEPHNEDAESLRDAADTLILQTPEPFSSREDALKAEAIAIHIAALRGLDVIPPDTGDLPAEEVAAVQDLQSVNRAGVVSSKWLAPAILRRDGEVDGAALTGTAIVSIKPEQIDDRPSPNGYLAGATFSARAAKWWQTAPNKRPHLSRLIAVLSGSGGVVIGSWQIDPNGAWAEPEGGVIPLLNPEDDNFEDAKGKRLVGIRTNLGIVYSHDLRA